MLLDLIKLFMESSTERNMSTFSIYETENELRNISQPNKSVRVPENEIYDASEVVNKSGLSSGLTVLPIDQYPYDKSSPALNRPWVWNSMQPVHQAIRDMLACCLGSGMVMGDYIASGSFGRVSKLMGVQANGNVLGSTVGVLYEMKNVVMKEGGCRFWGAIGFEEFEDKACLAFQAGPTVMKLLQAVAAEGFGIVSPYLFESWEVSLTTVPKDIVQGYSGQVGQYGQAMTNEGKSMLRQIEKIRRWDSDTWIRLLGTTLQVGFGLLHLGQFGFTHQDLSFNNVVINMEPGMWETQPIEIIYQDGTTTTFLLPKFGSCKLIDFDRMTSIASLRRFPWTKIAPTYESIAGKTFPIKPFPTVPPTGSDPLGYDANPYDVWMSLNADPAQFPYDPVAAFVGFTIFVSHLIKSFPESDIKNLVKATLLSLQRICQTWKTRSDMLYGLVGVSNTLRLMQSPTSSINTIRVFEREDDAVDSSTTLQALLDETSDVSLELYRVNTFTR